MTNYFCALCGNIFKLEESPTCEHSLSLIMSITPTQFPCYDINNKYQGYSIDEKLYPNNRNI